jgi:hypothetical protein
MTLSEIISIIILITVISIVYQLYWRNHYRCAYKNPDKRIGTDGKEPEWKE